MIVYEEVYLYDDDDDDDDKMMMVYIHSYIYGIYMMKYYHFSICHYIYMPNILFTMIEVVYHYI